MKKKAKGVLNKVAAVYSGALAAGISARKGKLDLAYLFLPSCSAAVGVYTKSAFAAPCVAFTKDALRAGKVKALIVNSGNANAATGVLGRKNAERTAKIAARELGIRPSEVVVSSTGIIGKQLPMDRFEEGLPVLLQKAERRDGAKFAEAIMTTDLVPKEVYREKVIGGVRVKMAGVCKGSGMIAPNMATMLAFLVTDVKVPKGFFQRTLREVTAASFNMMSVDTDTSTNDMFLAFSTGEKTLDFSKSEIRKEFSSLLLECAVDLAKQIAKDGEGATKLVEIVVRGGKTLAQARAVAKSIVDSPLVKTAIHGADPNWGRVAAAAGKIRGIRAEKVDISFAGTKVLRRGQPIPFHRDRLRKSLQKETVRIEVTLHLGTFEATAWGCDLTKGYIDINTAYN